MKQNTKEAISTLYGCRSKFTIIALTGQTATGRSRLASFMRDRHFYLDEDAHVRKPDTIKALPIDIYDNTRLYQTGKVDDCNKAIASMVFSKKYNICYNYIKENYKPFVIIKYTYVLWLFSLLKIKEGIKKEEGDKAKALKDGVTKILEDKFRPSHKDNCDVEYKDLCQKMKDKGLDTYSGFNKVLDSFSEWQPLYDQIKDVEENILDDLESSNKYNKNRLYDIIKEEDKPFCKFIQFLNEELAKLDYYCLCFMYHRMGVVIRNTGNPLTPCEESYKAMGDDSSHIYDVVKLINLLIKGCHKSVDDNINVTINPCRIVIDAIRNSMEALYFKERYSAFYMIAVHDDKNTEGHLRTKLEELCQDLDDVEAKRELINAQLNQVVDLGKIESLGKEVEKGKFASPNVAQCVADSEIHICNTTKAEDTEANYFFSMAEQWMKYAALIQHPGLITPSSEERCMEVAFTAKFNSGCLSRQVGAVITNKYHSIRTIGWNDVPYGHIPCSLRELSDLISPNPSPVLFSEYERSDKKVFEGKFTFIERVKNDYPKMLKPIYREGMKGLPLSYCFKSLQNKYEGEKNQVFTRSLHAEENAMMQMVRFGGESLMDGVIYVTASPCDLCCKKLYQIGVRKIVYIDEYPGISRSNIIENGYKRPSLKQFQGAYGMTYYKLYQPFMAYKDEIALRTKENNSPKLKTASDLLEEVLKEVGGRKQTCYSDSDYNEIMGKVKVLKEKAACYEKLLNGKKSRRDTPQ